VVKLGTARSALNPGDLRIRANPKSSIPVFTGCFKAGIHREALDKMAFLVEQINTAILY